MGEERRLQRDSSLPYQELQGRAVIVVPARRQMHQLDEVGTFLWNCIKKPRTAAELVDALCEEFDVSRTTAGEDVAAFLAELEEKGLVKAP